jgi:exodeoxyribonuclease V alpha subunit
MTSPIPSLAALREVGILRDLDVHLVESLCRICAAALSPAAQVLLALASRASGEGHACLDLESPDWLPALDAAPAEAPAQPAQLPGGMSAAEARDVLAAAPQLVGDGSATATPFVLEASRLYLRRFWNYERLVAQRLLERARALSAPAPANPSLEKAIDDAPLVPEQRDAVRKALSGRLAILTGGPGTGKTYVAAQFLLLLARHSAAGRPLRIRMAAPTGKAAARMDESLRDALGGQPLDLQIEPASTLDRLLGPLPNSPYFRHCRGNPIPADVVLVDETSMIDLPKMAKLLDALDESTHLVLLGDKDQLASVEPGSVLAEICDAAALRPRIATLSQSQRFPPGSPVARLAEAINEGRSDDAWRLAAGVGVSSSAAFQAKSPPAAFAKAVRDGYAPLLAAQSPQEAFAALAQFRVLCAMRRGPQGVDALNDAIRRTLFPRATGDFYARRPVLVTQNDYEANLYNGDVGIVWPDPQRDNELAVFFENRPRPVPCSRLPAHESAFAMTIHKAQGSGFGHVLALLPDRDSPLMTRELLYTAITRTRRSVDLWCAQVPFKAAVAKRTLRHMGLREKLDANCTDLAATE